MQEYWFLHTIISFAYIIRCAKWKLPVQGCKKWYIIHMRVRGSPFVWVTALIGKLQPAYVSYAIFCNTVQKVCTLHAEKCSQNGRFQMILIVCRNHYIPSPKRNMFCESKKIFKPIWTSVFLQSLQNGTKIK